MNATPAVMPKHAHKLTWTPPKIKTRKTADSVPVVHLAATGHGHKPEVKRNAKDRRLQRNGGASYAH